MKKMTISKCLIALLLSSTVVFGQKKLKTTSPPPQPVVDDSYKVDLKLLKNMKARSIGPAAMSGRITAVDAVWDNPDVIYAGAASGGVWKTENGGMTWTSVFDDNEIINIGSIAIQQSNPNIVWVGTGEGNPRNTVNLGSGIYKSIDGGKTWKSMGLEKTSNIHRILIDPSNPNTVYAGVIGNPFAEHPERGVYKTTDGGQTWKQILFTNNKSGVGDMVMDPTNPNKILVNMWEHKRTPYDFKSGGAGSGFYMTQDGGNSWKKLDETNGIPKGDLGRIGIAIAPSDPKIIYALIESSKNALYKSEDGGNSWKVINEDKDVVQNRLFYFCDLVVDPQNENRLYNVYQMISMSEDGGKTFKVIVPYTGVHPDHHAFWIHPKDPSFIINGNDGGVAISRDRGRKWTFAESIPVGQYYHVNVDNEIPYNVYGGLQDNGSWRGPAYTWTTGGLRNQYFESVMFGDGFDVVPDPTDSRYGYAMSQGGYLGRYDVKTGKTEFIKPSHPDKNTRLRFNWNSALALNPHNPSSLYYGSQFLHVSDDKGMNWRVISPDLTTNNKDQQKASDMSGGLSLDITSAENHNTILAIAPSPKDKNEIWVGTDDGNVQVTTDGGATWKNVAVNMPNLPKESWIPQIKASDYRAGEAFVVANNYRNGGGFIPYVYKTTNHGQTWTRIADEKKMKGYALCVLQDPVVENLIFVGTEQGLWVSFDAGKSYQQWKHGFPPVSTMDMTIHPRENDLVVATFGRALYVLDDIEPLREIARNKQVFAGNVKAFAAPKAYLSEEKDAPGLLFGGDAMYEGENRPRGARLSVYVKPSSKTDSLTQKIKYNADTLTVKIYDSSNQLIRTLKQKVDTVGIQRITWNLAEKANRTAGSKKPKPTDADMSGIPVLPGTYKLVYELKKSKDSTTIEVAADPRLTFSLADERAKRNLMKELQTVEDKLVKATDQLDDAKESVDRIVAQTKESEVAELKTLNKESKDMLKSIETAREAIFGKKIEKQGYGRPYQLTTMSKINDLKGYLRGKSVVTDAERSLLSQVKEMATESIAKVNQFLLNDWKTYRAKVEKAPLKWFKDVEEIK